MIKHQSIRLKNSELLTCEQVTWSDVREKVAAANPELTHIIDNIDPCKDYPLLLARYPYGVDIRQQGHGFFPVNHQLLTVEHPQFPTSLKKLLSYSSSPLGLVLNKAVEVYVETPEKRTVPFKLFSPGVTFGVWEIMDAPKVILRQSWDWSISAGGRTVFMPASINEMASYTKLQRKHQIKAYLPNTIFDQQKIFAEIAQHNDEPWCCEVLFFTNKWVTEHRHDPTWAPLFAHWSQQAWQQLMHWSNKMITEFNWEAFIAELSLRKIKPKTYLLDTMKHLINIACGTIPGFSAVDDSELVIPSRLIQQAYIEDYRLKTYSPLLMQPNFLRPGKDIKSVYYSLQYPTLPEKPPEYQTLPSAMKQLRELKTLVNIYLNVMSQWPTRHQVGQTYDFLEAINFDFFHVDKDKYGEIKQSSELAAQDPTLSKYPQHYCLKFPEGGHFFRGCVRISTTD